MQKQKTNASANNTSTRRVSDPVFVRRIIHGFPQLRLQRLARAKSGYDTRHLAGMLFELLRQLAGVFHCDDAIFGLQKPSWNAAGAHEGAVWDVVVQQRVPHR